MSSAGQPIDPVQALAQQQAMGAAGMSPQAVDPVQALAMGRVIQNAPQPEAAPPQDTGWADPRGKLSTIVRNVANAASFNLADPAAAAVGAITPALNGYASTKPTYGERFKELLKWSRGDTAEGQQAHPYVALGSSVAGGVLNPATLGMGAPKSLGQAIIQGANIGGAYGAGGSIGTADNLGDAAKQTMAGAATGGATGAAGYGLGKMLAGATRNPHAELLAKEGVPLTPGESLGGAAQTLEDATTHVPVLGNAIKSRQLDAVTGLNKAAYNRVLEPLGVKYDGPIGNDGIAKVSSIIDKAYDQAFAGAAVKQTPQFVSDLQAAEANAAMTLPAERAGLIKKNIASRITGMFGPNGVLDGDALIRAKNWFAEQSRPGSASSLDDRATADAYGTVLDALKDGIRDTHPDRGAMLDAADAAYSKFARVAQAASSNNASAKGGIFTSAQLGQALRGMDTSARKLDFSKGLEPMQDLAQAGQHVLPSTVPDSGTALRGLIELGIGGALTHSVAPEAAMGAAGLIGGGTALYSKPGQKLVNALLFGAPQTRGAIGKIPPALIPGLAAALVSAGNKPSSKQQDQSQ